jgi:hypothetical protein
MRPQTKSPIIPMMMAKAKPCWSVMGDLDRDGDQAAVALSSPWPGAAASPFSSSGAVRIR